MAAFIKKAVTAFIINKKVVTGFINKNTWHGRIQFQISFRCSSPRKYPRL